MAIAKKEVLYWTSCLLYGAVLTGVLLYIRFPAEKVRRYCERFVEDRLPDSSCSITSMKYIFPFRIVFEDIRVMNKKSGEELLFEDPQLSFEPVWSNPLHFFKVESTAFGGSHEAQMLINNEEKSLSFFEVEMKGVNLIMVPALHKKLNRKVSGTLDFSGTLTGKTDELSIFAAEGVASIHGGGFGLKKSILELNSLELVESSVHINLQKDTILLSKGELKNAQLNVSYEGNIALTKPWPESSLNIKGGIVPLAPLLQEKKQLKTIVARMQKKYKAQSLPYNVNGTIGRPTFTFGN
jgi:type II secretion system protein N